MSDTKHKLPDQYSFYAELHDTKVARVKGADIEVKPEHRFQRCPECKAWQGHEATCSKVTIQSIAVLLQNARNAEQIMRNNAARSLEHLHLMTGKVAILRHENNKLRRANERLRARLERHEP